jgi:hypothetical protein
MLLSAEAMGNQQLKPLQLQEQVLLELEPELAPQEFL